MILRYLTAALVMVILPLDARVAQENHAASDRALAERYIKQLASGNSEELEELLAPNAVFEDPTSVALNGSTRRFEGREAILRFARSRRAGSSNTTVKITRAYRSGDHMALWISYVSHADAGLIGANAEAIATELNTFTVLRIRGGLVEHQIEHIDYDYILRKFSAHDAGADAQDTSSVNERLARTYLDQVYGEKLEEMRRLLALDVRFHDSFAGLSPVRGSDAVASALERSYESRGRHRVRQVFTSGPLVILSLDITIGTADEATAVAGTTVLRMANGQVVEHIDYMDHDGPDGWALDTHATPVGR